MRLKLHQANCRGRNNIFLKLYHAGCNWARTYGVCMVLLNGARHLWSRAFLGRGYTLDNPISTLQFPPSKTPYQFDFCKGIQPEFGRRDLAQQSGELDFGIWLQPESGTCDLAKQSAELDVSWSILAEFGRRDLAGHFEHIALQWCSGQLFAMRRVQEIVVLRNNCGVAC